MAKKNVFYVSLIYHGLRGGAMYMDENAVVYRNQTATLEQKYKHLTILFTDIKEVECNRCLLLPAVTIHTNDQTQYRFVLFGRKRFLQTLESLKEK